MAKERTKVDRSKEKCSDWDPVRQALRGHLWDFVEKQGTHGLFRCRRCRKVSVMRIKEKEELVDVQI